MNDPPDGDVLSLNADSLTLTAECNHVLYKPCIVININKPHHNIEFQVVKEGRTPLIGRKAAKDNQLLSSSLVHQVRTSLFQLKLKHS